MSPRTEASRARANAAWCLPRGSSGAQAVDVQSSAACRRQRPAGLQRNFGCESLTSFSESSEKNELQPVLPRKGNMPQKNFARSCRSCVKLLDASDGAAHAKI